MDLQNEALTTLIERTSILLNQMRSKNNLDSMAVKELEENFLDMNQVIKQMDIDVSS